MTRKSKDYKNRFYQLYNRMLDGYSRVGADGYFIECNPAFRNMLGYTEEEIRKLTPRDITPRHWHALDIRIEQEEMTQLGHSRIYEKEQIRKNGDIFPIEIQLYRNCTEDGHPDGFWGVVRDISEKKMQQAHVDFLSSHDTLTQLPNRALLLEQLEHILSRARFIIAERNAQEKKDAAMQPYQVGMLFIDFDRFKNVNDTLGHVAGDALLQIVARKISSGLRESDFLVRFGGDEFIVLLETPTSPKVAENVAQRILSLFSEPISLEGQEIYITASIGIALFPDDGDETSSLIRHADLAMSHAKNAGGNTFRFYEPELGLGIEERMTLEHALRGALQRQEFILHYQPQFSLTDGKLVGVEALLRWRHPVHGLVPPNRFIPIAENTGIIYEIENWVLEEACRQMRKWHQSGVPVPRVAVNISVQQLAHNELLAAVDRYLQKYNLRPQMLELEVTESMLMQKPEQTLPILNSIKKLGVYLAIDDFGTGYSSLGYLKNLPVHRLKIDYSFVRDIGQDTNDEAITRAIIALSDNLGLETVAEGVERENQELFLKEQGCQIVQGFRYCHPVPSDEITKYYKSLQT